MEAMYGVLTSIEALTLAHFLIVEPRIAVAQKFLDNKSKGLLTRSRLTQQIVTTFWQSGNTQYLPSNYDQNAWKLSLI